HYIRERPRQVDNSCLAVGSAPGNPAFLRLSFEGEAKEVGQIFEGRVVVGDYATRKFLLQNLSQTAVVHIAAHGRFVRDAPLESGVALAPESKAKLAPDYTDVLTGRDFVKSGLNATLVVLSACQTGLNAVYPGGELEG